MRIFLTGSTGFIGQSLVRAMRQRDWPVQVLVRDQNGTAAQWLSDQGCTVVAGDVTRPEGLARAMAGADAVVHAAGVYEWYQQCAQCCAGSRNCPHDIRIDGLGSRSERVSTGAGDTKG